MSNTFLPPYPTRIRREPFNQFLSYERIEFSTLYHSTIQRTHKKWLILAGIIIHIDNLLVSSHDSLPFRCAFSRNQIQILQLPAKCIISCDEKQVLIKVMQCMQDSRIDSHCHSRITFLDLPKGSTTDSGTLCHKFCRKTSSESGQLDPPT